MKGKRRGQVFLSYTWADQAEVDVIESALEARGVSVFRDQDIALFDGITERLLHAVESSALLLAFYSRRYPTRYACQWELTSAFLAAARLGNPHDRVLLINPEADEKHIAPIDLEDAAYFTWTRDADVERLADRVVAKLDSADGVPFGPLPAESAVLPGSLLRPRRFVGRYREMWAVHSALHAGRRPAVHAPEAHSVAVVSGPPGIGKTELAEQYGFLFRGTYPGGVVWCDLSDDERRTPDERTHSVVSRVARERFALDVSGMAPPQARETLAARCTAAGEDVLWVVDDVPAEVSLGDLVVPSPRVHTLVTAKTVSSDWPVGSVPIGGLSEIEGEELFRAEWPDLDRDERAAIARLVQRCHGHPLVLVPAVARLRHAQSTGALDQVLGGSAEEAEVVAGLAAAIRTCGPSARVVLGFAAVLAQAPFGGDLLVDGVAEVLGPQAPTEVATAIGELYRHSLLRRVDRGLGTGRQAWQLHALVATAVRSDLDRPFLDRFAVRAADLLLGMVTGPTARADMCRHATAVAGNPAVPLTGRLELLRAVAAVHEDHGDVPAAKDARYEVVRLAGPDWRTDDVLEAARLAMVAGDTAMVLRHAAAVIDRAHRDRDVPAEYRARLLVASAHDLRGDYPAATLVFHDHALVAREGLAPTWMPADERGRAALTRVRALRVRGEYPSATALLRELLPEIQRADPLGSHRGAWPVATIEHARLLLLSGEVKASRTVASEVVRAFADAGLPRHHLAREASTVHAEAELAVAFSERRARPTQWQQASKRVGRALAESREWYGEDSLLTLDLAVLYGQTMQNNSRSDAARRELVGTEERIAAAAGPDHPLALRARQWIGLATMGLKDWRGAVEVFDSLLPRQNRVLGRRHPDSQLTRFQLGACLGMRNEGDDLLRARVLIDEAKDVLRDQHGPWHEWAMMAWTGSVLTRLPRAVWWAFRWFDGHSA